MIYSVREVDHDSCGHLALVEGPDMNRLEAAETFRRLLDEYTALRRQADQAFTDAFGWYNKPLQGLQPENYHKRWREELRKAGCWSYLEFVCTRGFKAVAHRDVELPRDHEGETECHFARVGPTHEQVMDVPWEIFR